MRDLEMKALLFAALFALVACAAAAVNGSTAKPTPKPTPRPSIAQICNRSIVGLPADHRCGACVKNSKCFYCITSRACKPYPAGHVFPSSTDCPPDMGSARWGTCFVNFKVLLIVMGVLAGLLLIVLPCCIYCCCCRGRKMSEKNRKRLAEEESKWQEQESERKARHNERKEERKKRYDEIRQKYGLSFRPGDAQSCERLVKPGTSGTSYQRFDNDA